MPGITEADMTRINEFVKRTKFERDPEQLCPGDDTEEGGGEATNTMSE